VKAGRRAAVVAAAVVATPAVARAQDGGALDFRGRFEALAVNAEGLPAPERLHALFDLAWERSMTWFPEFATYVGYAEGDHGAWTDMSLEAIRGREERLGDPLAVLEAIPRDSLGPEDRLSYDLFRRDTEVDVEGARFPAELLAINQLGGVRGGGTAARRAGGPDPRLDRGAERGGRSSLSSYLAPAWCMSRRVLRAIIVAANLILTLR
jgi:hypothetical protein